MTNNEEMAALIERDDAGTLTADEAMRLMYLLHGSCEAETAIQRAVREDLAEIKRLGLVVSDLHTLGGTPRFRGTRVPAGVVDEKLADGIPLDEILDAYLTLDRADVEAYVRLRYPRIAVAVDCLTDEEIERIANAEIPPEHRWDLDHVPE